MRQILNDFYNIQMSVHAAILKFKKHILFPNSVHKFYFQNFQMHTTFFLSNIFFHISIIFKFYNTLSNKKHSEEKQTKISF